jgi:hypothetical protein
MRLRVESLQFFAAETLSAIGGKLRQRSIRLVVALAAAMPAFGTPIVNLNTASSFGLLGGTISNTGTSVVTGNVGVNVAGTITGFNPTGTTVGGSVIPPNSTASTNAYADFVSAFNAAVLLPSTQSYNDLTMNRTFTGNNVYTFTMTNISTTTGINLTFDAQNNPNEIFVIRTDGAFTVNGAMTFTLQNQAQSSHIFWIIGTSATISVGISGPITFDGDILAGQAFTMSAASGGSGDLAGTINGCVFAETANTLAGTTNVNGCSATGSGTVPEPGSSGMVSLGLLLGILAWRKLRS